MERVIEQLGKPSQATRSQERALAQSPGPGSPRFVPCDLGSAHIYLGY